MISKFFVVLAVLHLSTSKEMERIEPKGYNYTDSAEQITLAITEKVSIPLFGAISESISFIPNNSSQCSFSNIQTKYNQVAVQTLERAENSIVTSILPLKSKGLIFLIDQYFSLSTFQLTKDQKLKQLISSRKVYTETSKSIGSTPKLVSTFDESTVYILSSYGYSYFSVDSLSTGLKMLKETPHESEEIFKVQILNNKLYVASGVGGIKVYRIEQNKQLKYLYNLIQKDIYSTDFVIDKIKKLLYVMDYNSGVYVYDISEEVDENKQPINLNNLKKDNQNNQSVPLNVKPNVTKRDSVPSLSDFLNFSNYTSTNTDIEVFDNTILIMFTRNFKNIVAEFYYDPIDKTYTFIRYFKFQAQISEIILLKDNFVTIGNEFLGIFPVGIHPKLIKKELNGFVTISNIKTAVAFSPPYFVGVTPNSLILAEVKTEKYQVIQCILKEKSLLEKIIYKANRTTCSNGTSRQYYEYCAYEKQYIISKMEIVAREEIANFVWVLLSIFSVFIIVGVITLLIMRHKKVKRIKRIEEEFEEKRKNVALPSERMSARVGQDANKGISTEAPMIS